MAEKIKKDVGIYTGVPFDEYMKWEGISNTILTVLREQSPLHAAYRMAAPEEATPALLQGQVIHCKALELDKFDQRYAICPDVDRRTREGKATYEAFMVRAGTKTVISQEQAEIADIIAITIRSQIIHRFIAKGEAEVCIVWDDKKTGLRCKARLDYVHRDRAIIVDLKSTEDASPKRFARTMMYYRLYQQAGFYGMGWKALTGDETSFVFLPAEKSPPYAVAAYEVGDKTIQAGKLECRKALDIYADCLSKNTWPAYAHTVEVLDIGDYSLKELGVNQYQLHIEE